MDKDNVVKELFLRFMEKMENLVVENVALRTLLDAAPEPAFRKNWKTEFDKLVTDPKLKASVHGGFQEVYTELGGTLDQAAALALLSRVSIKGKAN